MQMIYGDAQLLQQLVLEMMSLIHWLTVIVAILMTSAYVLTKLQLLS